MIRVFLSRYLQPESDHLAAAARRSSWQITDIDMHRPIREPKEAHTPAFYGDTETARHLLRTTAYTLLEPSFDLLARLPRRYLRRQVECSTLAEALSRGGPIFVKPADCCTKFMVAKVWPSGRAISMRDRKEAPEDSPVLIAEPVRWKVEYRMFVLHRRIIACSPYRRDGVRAMIDTMEPVPVDVGEQARLLAGGEELLADPSLDFPPAFVLDAGLLEDGSWAVVELNPLWCSRMYACEAEAVLPALPATCLLKSQLPPELARWVVRRSLSPSNLEIPAARPPGSP